MRKGWIVLLTAVLVVAFAAPAMADLKVTGFYRSKAMLSNFFDGRGGPSLRSSEEEQTNAYVEQRARIKFDVGTENARAVFHFESDMNWGVGSGQNGARNGGGALSSDSVQLETKEVYVWFKIPDTSITAKVGMQSVNDHYAGIFSNGADFAAIMVNGTFEPVKWTLGWGKLYESDLRDNKDTDGDGVTNETSPDNYNVNDDANIYIASVQFAPGKDTSVGVNFYWVQDDTGRDGAGAALAPGHGTQPFALEGYIGDIYMPGVNFATNLGAVKLSGFAFYQFGKLDDISAGTGDLDISAFMLDLRADVKLGPGNFFFEGFYISGDDDEDQYGSIITLGDYQRGGNRYASTSGGTGGNSGFGRTNMYFLFGADSLNVSQCLIGCSGGELGDSFGNAGYGLWHLAAGYSQKFTEKLKGAVNVGYIAAAEDNANGDSDIGLEANVRLDYTISKGLDVSLVGAYLKAGDFVTVEENLDDSYYMGYVRLAYSF